MATRVAICVIDWEVSMNRGSQGLSWLTVRWVVVRKPTLNLGGSLKQQLRRTVTFWEVTKKLNSHSISRDGNCHCSLLVWLCLWFHIQRRRLPQPTQWRLCLLRVRRAPSSPRSNGFCIIWDCISSSSSSYRRDEKNVYKNASDSDSVLSTLTIGT